MSAEHERILVIDDEVNMLALFEMVLSEEGYDVVCVSSGEDAVKRLKADWFDLVISDLMMQGMDGFALLEQAKALRSSQAFLMVTAHGSDQQKDKPNGGCPSKRTHQRLRYRLWYG